MFYAFKNVPCYTLKKNAILTVLKNKMRFIQILCIHIESKSNA